MEVSLPLVLSMGATTVMEFTDRIFLGNHSLVELAAATPAGITSFLFTAFFIGVASYANVFIAQYTGAGEHEMVGTSLWQGLYFAILGALFMIFLAQMAQPLFAFINHSPEVQRLEVIYFRILCFGTGFSLIGTTLSCFYSGRGLTWTVMVIQSAGTLVNIPLDYALIYGKWGFPELGIQGAATATVFSWFLIATLFALTIFTRTNQIQFKVWSARSFNPKLFLRMMHFGIPGGFQFFLEILAFTFFILMVGRLGDQELVVTNLVLSINAMAYMPMFGFSMGVSTLVGQAMGGREPEVAQDAARSTAHIALIYVLFLSIIFLFLPEPLIKLFLPSGSAAATTSSIIAMGTILLRFVAVYLFFDALAIIYTGVLKGAGDTRFVMTTMLTSSTLFLFIPVWVGVFKMGLGLYFSWSCITFYIFVLYLVLFARYRGGEWKRIQVIQS